MTHLYEILFWAISSPCFRLSHLLPKEPGLRPWMRRGVPLPFRESHLTMETPICQLHNQVCKQAQTQREKTAVRAHSPALVMVRKRLLGGKTKEKKRNINILHACHEGPVFTITNVVIFVEAVFESSEKVS